MRQQSLSLKWILLVCLSLREICSEAEKPQWSKPEQSISAQNNDWIPVQGKCPTCRPNRDLESQSTNEQIGQVLTPPRSPSVPPPPPAQQLQFINKQPRILPFGGGFPQYNNPFINTDNKQYQAQASKLYTQEQPKSIYSQEPPKSIYSQEPPKSIYSQEPPKSIYNQEPQKSFYQFETPFPKQAYSLPPQQLIPQSPLISQAQPALPQQRFPFGDPYPFTLPLKGLDSTTPKVVYQPKIRFPDSEPPKLIPHNKITSQNTDEIQLLYVPIEATQRGRKNMKEIYNQNQYQPPLPHGFVAPQYNFQYSAIPKQPESQFYFPSNVPPPTNYLQLNPAPQQRPETVYANLTKNLLQPYFTINGLYSSLPQMPQQVPNKQEIPYYSLIQQPTIYNTNPIKTPEQIFKAPPPLPPRQESLPVSAPGGMFIHNGIPNTISTFADVYAPTTTEVTKSTDYITERTAFKGTSPDNKVPEFNYQFVTNNPQTSASQNQHLFSDNTLTSPQQNLPQFTQSPMTSKIPQLRTSSQTPYEETPNPNYPVPHQPPLSFYMEKVHNPKINDVLYLLKDSKTIPVLDTVETDPPQVFVGPSELPPPKGYIKFELPYLSSLDYNRIERMIDRLPFFVAPLNFKPPPGYSKIPFPAPHIGSVVLSNTTYLQESLHDKPFDQKYKPSTIQPFTAPPELSTITPQLTSQINSLLDTSASVNPSELTSFKNFAPASPPLPEAVTFKTYTQSEEITKKPLKSTYRPPSTTTTEQPKRTSNRQRKPIYRGYPSTSTETSTRSTTESTKNYYTEPSKANEYVEFTAKGKFNINNGNENAISSNPPSESTYQVPSTAPSYQPAPETNRNQYDFSNVFSSVPQQNQPAYETQPDFYSSGTSNYSDNQNYSYYSSQSTTDVKSDSTINLVNNSEPQPTQPANFNFNNVKPLSQYSHDDKDPQQNNSDLSTKIIDEPNSNEFHFWTQNQFYKANPSAVDYFSSTTTYPQDTSSATPEPTRTPTTEFSYAPEPSSTENTDQTTPTTHRPRLKQRIYPNRYHQSKHTTEKENVDGPAYRTSTRHPPASDSTSESSTSSSDMLSQSTENHESSTRADVKPHRRRRPVKPHNSNIVTPVTEVSSSTSRSYRTRPTRYPSSATERYRARRPTTSTSSESTETLNSEWSSYNNFLPSAAGSNEINNANEGKYSSSYWTDSSFPNQNQEISSSTEAIYAKSSSEETITENSPWLSSNKQSASSEFSYPPTAQNQQFTLENAIGNQTETASERKDESHHSEVKNTYRRPLKTTYYEEPSSTVSTTEAKQESSYEPTSFESDKVYSEEGKKDRFSIKDSSDGAKKVYDPQDEKKISGKRRLAFVRRIRINKRPQELETAESQNLGRITENSLQSSDSKVISKTEEKEDFIKPKSSTTSSGVSDEHVVSTEAVDKESLTTMSPTSTTSTNTGEDGYAMQNDFAQMLSDFLNSNDHSTKTVNNLERNNVSTENSISYILSLSNDNGGNIISNSSSSNVSPTNTPNEITGTDDLVTITNIPNTEYPEHPTTTEAEIYTIKHPATSTTTEISLETEICYRGKCVKTKKSKASDLLPVE